MRCVQPEGEGVRVGLLRNFHLFPQRAATLLVIQNKLVYVLSNMDFEWIFARFPHVGKKIFEDLDNKNLTNCREVCKSWEKFIFDEKITWNRILTKFPSAEGMYVSRASLHDWLKSVYCKKTFVQSSFLSKALSFSLTLF